jgi:cell wall-associated NlpC family hydrolase
VLHGRKRNATVVATLIALLTALVSVGVGLADVETASAKPTLQTVKKQVELLDRQAEAASERYNEAKVKYAATQTQLTALSSDLGRQQQVVTAMREQVAELVVEQFQGNALSTTSQLILSNNPDVFLEKLNAVSAYNSQRGQVMTDYSTELDRLNLRKGAVQAEAAQLKSLKVQMGAEKNVTAKKAAMARNLLDSLQTRLQTTATKARAQVFGGGYTGAIPAIPSVAGSNSAATALRFALAQVGKAYSYGASGPNAFDCSGLTMAAWGAAGVGLPHSAAAQQGSGMRIPESDLRPGDLVFYYSPVSHVGMYIGNGLIVSAENPSVGIKITGLHSMPYSGAVRPG